MAKKKSIKQKIAKTVAVASMVTLVSVNTLAANFTDIKTTNWAYAGLQDMQERGIMLPNSKGEILPSRTMDYFEMSDVIAKATGYVDVSTATNIDAAFKESVLKNYEKQLPTIEKYSAKYSNWDGRYNQQIAYILGRGYITESDLAKFVVKTTAGTQVKKIVTKQDLSAYTVRILGKENTAKEAYNTSKTTGFSDENTILESNRPHVSYLRAIGLISGDENGAFGGSVQVTRALCAKMISDGLSYKEKYIETVSNEQVITLKKIMNKSTSEYFVYYEKDGQSSWATLKTSTSVTDKEGKTVDVTTMLNAALELKATVTRSVVNDTDYITSMKLQETTQSTGTVVTLNGTLARVGSYGDITITLSDQTTKTYMVDTSAIITLEGQTVSLQELPTDALVVVKVESNVITQIRAQKGAVTTPSSLTEGEVVSKKIGSLGHIFTVTQGTKTVEWVVDSSTMVTRNNKKASVYDIRIGDTLKAIKKDNAITEVASTGVKTTVDGTVQAVYIAGVPQLTIKTDRDTQVLVINGDSEIYDNNERKDISIREIRLGQTVELLVDSKEIISLVVQRGSASVKYMGSIESIGSGNDYMDILVDYDPLTDNSKVLKRVKLPVTTKILLNSKEQHRSQLDIGMDVVVTYTYMDDSFPERVLIIE